MATDCDIVNPDKGGWFPNWLSWTRSSTVMLRAAEKKILSYLKTAYRGWYVDIGPIVGSADKIWTISLNEESPKTPVLMLHGLGAGVAMWVMNLDTLASSRPVYAIDLLGFGRSSRPSFNSDAKLVEMQLINSVEEWRKEMNIDHFILLGHSMGGFLAASYSMQYPDRVKHLILADPWGFPERPANVSERYQLPLWVRAVGAAVQPLNPLWAIRAAGPLGQWMVEKARPDLIRKFAQFIPDAETVIPQYIYQCNSQYPSGESAFHAMMHGFGWAKHPIMKRIDNLRSDIPITLLFGSRSWVDNVTGEIIKKHRPNSSYVNVQIINGAGHHVYLDKPEIFNKYVKEACEYTERAVVGPPVSQTDDNAEENDNKTPQIINIKDKTSLDIPTVDRVANDMGDPVNSKS